MNPPCRPFLLHTGCAQGHQREQADLGRVSFHLLGGRLVHVFVVISIRVTRIRLSMRVLISQLHLFFFLVFSRCFHLPPPHTHSRVWYSRRQTLDKTQLNTRVMVWVTDSFTGLHCSTTKWAVIWPKSNAWGNILSKYGKQRVCLLLTVMGTLPRDHKM